MESNIGFNSMRSSTEVSFIERLEEIEIYELLLNPLNPLSWSRRCLLPIVLPTS